MGQCMRWYLALLCAALASHSNVASGAQFDGIVVETLRAGSGPSYDTRRVLDSHPPFRGARAASLRGSVGPQDASRFQVSRDLRGTSLGMAGGARDQVMFDQRATDPRTAGEQAAAGAPIITVRLPSPDLGPPTAAMDTYQFEDAPTGQSSIASILEGSQAGAHASQLYWLKTPYSVGAPHVDRTMRIWVPLTPDVGAVDEELADGGTKAVLAAAGTNTEPVADMGAKSFAGARAGNRMITEGQLWVMAPFIVGDEHYDPVMKTHFVSVYSSPNSGGTYEVDPPLPGSQKVID